MRVRISLLQRRARRKTEAGSRPSSGSRHLGVCRSWLHDTGYVVTRGHAEGPPSDTLAGVRHDSGVTKTDYHSLTADGRPAAQARDVPLDAHLHTDLSPDSGVPLELYCAQAAERGVREIAITDHLDFMPGAPAYQYASYKRREGVVRDACT